MPRLTVHEHRTARWGAEQPDEHRQLRQATDDRRAQDRWHNCTGWSRASPAARSRTGPAVGDVERRGVPATLAHDTRPVVDVVPARSGAAAEALLDRATADSVRGSHQGSCGNGTAQELQHRCEYVIQRVITYSRATRRTGPGEMLGVLLPGLDRYVRSPRP
jgi:antitoxin (DNA-binding transcriptional repressor) of toxin-antitoxin stability system